MSFYCGEYDVHYTSKSAGDVSKPKQNRNKPVNFAIENEGGFLFFWLVNFNFPASATSI